MNILKLLPAARRIRDLFFLTLSFVRLLNACSQHRVPSKRTGSYVSVSPPHGRLCILDAMSEGSFTQQMQPETSQPRPAVLRGLAAAQRWLGGLGRGHGALPGGGGCQGPGPHQSLRATGQGAREKKEKIALGSQPSPWLLV